MNPQIDHFLNSLLCSRKTIDAYKNALIQFTKVVGENADLTVATYMRFLDAIQDKSYSTQRVYTTAVRKFYRFCRAKDSMEIQETPNQHKGKSRNSRVKFNFEAVKKVINYCDFLQGNPVASQGTKLEALRDRAFVLTLADTGLRISEACALQRGDIAWSEQRAIIGKGDKQSIIRFSNRSLQALQEYLDARAYLDQSSPLPLANQPLFARHDIRASKKVRPITPGGMWKAVKDRITEAGVDRSTVRIHDFRHYFVAMTYFVTRDMKVSQELARHASISMTNHYIRLDGEIDAAYDRIFNKK